MPVLINDVADCVDGNDRTNSNASDFQRCRAEARLHSDREEFAYRRTGTAPTRPRRGGRRGFARL